MQTLENVLTAIEEQEKEVVYQPFVVTDLETAAEASRRISYFEGKKAEIDSIIEAQIAPFLAKIEKIKEWGVQAKQEFVDKQSHYSGQLESYLRAEVTKQLEAGKKAKKTIPLPFGKMSLTKQQPEYQKDKAVLLEYAKTAGYAEPKWETKWSELKKDCTVVDGSLVNEETGEIVPGVVVVEREDKFEFKLEG
ncbi:host-nuclease inhibitor Gam family protein [Bacillus sp. 03113]|uniref:host-nuclease inhibitor Gam family protein n=1 Tax=Bacillus sp. 03113 TaxID=2578211 RepID=UPI001141BBCF|nr:host-nuclease inhibitor Gam family protein [Bacillus sp. 03113]